MLIEKNGFIYHLFFGLKNPDSKQELNQFTDGLKKLSKAPTIKEFHIGIPANTKRGVIDYSYSVSRLLLFKNAYGQDVCQTDSIHLKFIDERSQLWSKVVIYDTISFAD